MLSYLTGTHPDILFDVHSCACFSADLRMIHEKAIKRIVVKYLLGTADKGIILDPLEPKGIECFVDTGFAGDYVAERSHEPSTLLSCTGYLIHLWNCLVI